jgi:hypothetical protein
MRRLRSRLGGVLAGFLLDRLRVARSLERYCLGWHTGAYAGRIDIE